MTYRAPERMSIEERDYLQYLFGEHISKAQVRYLRTAHMDVYERDRKGATFTDAVSGKRFYDCFNSAGSFNCGRGNEAIRDALCHVAMRWIHMTWDRTFSSPRTR